jgi:hypothetical protein
MTLSRREAIVAATLFAAMGARRTLAGTARTIDRRVRSENRSYGLTFAAELPSDDSLFGHAFIVWQREDDLKKMSTADAIGFYPTGEPKDIEVIFGTSGGLETDFATMADLKLTVLLNSDLYTVALDRKAKWMANGRYSLLWQNCTTHVADIAKSIGLNSSNGKWEKPQNYVADLIKNNQ